MTLIVAACQLGGGSAGTPAPSVAPTPGPGEFQNPVLDRNFPDPGVIEVDGTYYAYATQQSSWHIQLARSSDLVSWEHLGDALPRLPLWATGDTWAPEVFEIGDRYVMYYTARYPAAERPDGQGSQCIGSAVSETPEGPFVDDSEAPLVCQPDLGGSIDATAFTDSDGTMYLVWKNDGNCCSQATEFWGQELSADGLSLVGEVTNLGVRNDARWEAHVIEAPTILLHEETYFLFYSANHFGGPDYAVGYATAADVLGPYTDAEENPILAKPEGQGVQPFGPGHQAVVADDDGDLWMLYHAWNENFTRRDLWIDELVFQGGVPRILGPDTGPQPVP